MPSHSTVELTAGHLSVRLNPFLGGAIQEFAWSDEGTRMPIMRPSPSVPGSVLELANFPLVPFVNRIRGGSFAFRGREVRLAANMEGDPSPLHGQGWLHPWDVATTTAATAELTYRHAAGEWPWAYEARQEFALDGNGLSFGLTCRNLSDEPMPCGLGQHPYFPCTSETRLDTRVEHVWTIDEHVLPVAQEPAEGRFDLRERLVCGQDLDHGFGGWGGEARLSDPSWPFKLRLSSPNARFFQLYSPPKGGIFVAEPVSHANAALNAPEKDWPELGLQVLEPGDEMRLDMRLDVLAVPSAG